MIIENTAVYFWRFETGESVKPDSSVINPTDFSEISRGWYCSVCPEDDSQFTDWMKMACPTAKYKINFRRQCHVLGYNVHITDEAEACLFMLRWL